MLQRSSIQPQLRLDDGSSISSKCTNNLSGLHLNKTCVSTFKLELRDENTALPSRLIHCTGRFLSQPFLQLRDQIQSPFACHRHESLSNSRSISSLTPEKTPAPDTVVHSPMSAPGASSGATTTPAIASHGQALGYAAYHGARWAAKALISNSAPAGAAGPTKPSSAATTAASTAPAGAASRTKPASEVVAAPSQAATAAASAAGTAAPASTPAIKLAAYDSRTVSMQAMSIADQCTLASDIQQIIKLAGDASQAPETNSAYTGYFNSTTYHGFVTGKRSTGPPALAHFQGALVDCGSNAL